MSSATSIDGQREVERVEDKRAGVSTTTGGEGFRPIHFFILASLIAATAAVVMSHDPSPAHLILISLTIAAVGLAAAGVYRTLAPLVTADVESFREPLSERARAATEREKALVLRSLKELEFDKAMGKLSERDFEEMAGRLRSRAIAIMKRLQEGEGGYRAMVERDLQARVADRARRSGAPPPVGLPVDLDPSAFADRDQPAPAAPDQRVAADPERSARACAACDTRNDPDAAFCKRCGARLG